MRRCLGMAGLAMILMASPSVAQDKGMLTGTAWKVVKSEHAPAGTTIQFAADGKLTITVQIDGKQQQLPGTFTLTGAHLVLKFTNNGREITDTRVIKKISETILVTEDRNQKLEELQR